MFEMRPDPDGVLWLSGELDLTNAEELIRVGSSLSERHPDLVLDLSDLAFMDSSGIRAVLAIAERSSGSVLLREPNGSVRKVIDLTGIVGRHGIALDA
jgi:anti-sigma B factor antagonist